MTAIERAAGSIDDYLDDKGITLGDDEVRELAAIIKRELEKAVPARDTSNDLCLQYRSTWDRDVGFNQCRKAMGLGDVS